MQWNTDITAIPYGDEVLLKVKYKPLPYYMFHLCEKHGRMGEEDRFVLTDNDDEELTNHLEIVAWVNLEKECDL